MYYKNSNSQDKHLVFTGRWNPFHKGHIHIIITKIKEKRLPVLILVRDSSQDKLSAKKRSKIIKTWMKGKKINGSIMIIPDIEGIYYGRGVGYNVEEIVVSEKAQSISATKIRKSLKLKDGYWKTFVPESIHKLIKRYYK